MIKEDPTDPAREQKRANLHRYEEARRQHLGTAVTLLFGLAVAGTGFGIKYLADHGAGDVSPTRIRADGALVSSSNVHSLAGLPADGKKASSGT